MGGTPLKGWNRRVYVEHRQQRVQLGHGKETEVGRKKELLKSEVRGSKREGGKEAGGWAWRSRKEGAGHASSKENRTRPKGKRNDPKERNLT